MPHRNEAFQATWQQFTQLNQTYDTLAKERIGGRRWRWRLPDIAFVFPVEDEAVIAQCVNWQRELGRWFQYEPQPPSRLHITLHYLGDLRQYFWQWRLTTWRRAALPEMADKARKVLAGFDPFEVTVGPLNAFSTAAFAEVHGDNRQLDQMREALKVTLPLRASMLHPDRDYLPHITLGYWGSRPTGRLVEALSHYRQVEPVPLRLERVKFTIYARDTVPLKPDVLHTAREEVLAEYPL